MVAPVTGPFAKFPSYPFADAFQRGYRQAMPVDRPLSYEMYWVYGRRHDVSTMTGQPTIIEDVKSADFDLFNDPLATKKFITCRNQAYERLRSQLGATAGWAENLAQIGKTRQSIIQRATQLGSFASAIRKGRFADAARVLRTPIPSGVSNRKAAAQNFLEFEYGWKPLFSDLVSSADALTSFPEIRIPLYGKSTDVINTLVRNRSSGPTWNNYSFTVVNGVVGVKLQTVARIVNPNLFLANQLGVIDFALPWKLIPFSFVVDWFVNVEQVISSVSDWYGVELLHPHTTYFAKGHKMDVSRNYAWSGPGVIPGWASSFTRDHERDSVHMSRELGISGPTLAMKPFRGFSLERGAQALSLVLSVLGK